MLWKKFSETADKNRYPSPVLITKDRQMTLPELLSNAEALARQLTELNMGPGKILVCILESAPEFLITLLACSKIGCAFSPIGTISLASEVQSWLDFTTPDCVIGESSTLSSLDQYQGTVLYFTANHTLKMKSVMQLRTKQQVTPDIGMIICTSGSTASPKGVMISHQALVRRSEDIVHHLQLNALTRTLCILPLSHPHGLECLALPTLLAGGSLYVIKPQMSFPLFVLEEMSRLRITYFSAVPTFYALACEVSVGKDLKFDALSSALSGSAALPPEVASRFNQKFGINIQQGYGLAELPAISLNPKSATKAHSIGKPLGSVMWKLETVAASKHKELVVRSACLFSGYFNDNHTTERQIKDGWFYTSDQVNVIDGYFYLAGRIENFAKIRGFKVDLQDIEHLLASSPWVEEAIVVQDPRSEEKEESITAFIVPKLWPASALELQKKITDYLGQRVQSYMIPGTYEFKDKLPKTQLSKPIRSYHRLKEM